ncbi:MAG: hypothetical protein GKR89_30895 [Candidatus Latescibacteria bacterium]|nr:hypothetical protein [Candidatus Latescibacterota bacterium]
MDRENRDLLDKYIGRLLELQETRKWQLSEEELQEIALEIGLTEADLAQVKQAVEDRIQRGATYADTGNWSAATAEYEAAVEFDPIGVRTRYQLADFYFRQWRQTGKGKDELDAAIDKCLQLDPDSVPAKELLLKVGKTNRRRRLRRWIKGLALAIAAPIVLLTVFAFLRETGIITPSPSGLEGLAYTVAVEVVPIEAGEGIATLLDDFEINHEESVYRQDLFDFQYVGRIVSDRYEVQKLRYNVDFLDASGQVLASDYLWLFNANSGYSGDQDNFTLHPGDLYLFASEGSTYFDGVAPTRIVTVRVHPTLVERVRPPAQYPEYPLKALQWRSQQVDYLTFELRQRESAYYNDQYGRPRHYLQLEITHKGTQPCRELVLGIEWLDEAGTVVDSWEEVVVSLAHKPVEPGTRLIVNQQAYFDEEDFPADGKPFAEYRVYIKTAD